MIVVELKQWSSSKLSDKDGIVIARRGGASERKARIPAIRRGPMRPCSKGSTRRYTKGGVGLRPCAYLHNYVDDGVIDDAHYAPYMEQGTAVPQGRRRKRERLRAFIKQHVKHGDNAELLYKIENGRIRPSKMLADSLVKMLKGNREFVLVDDQKVVYETALAGAKAPLPKGSRS